MERFFFLLPRPLDLLQIFLVAAALYYVLKVVARTRAMHMLAGLFVLVLTYFLARVLALDFILFILEQLFQYGVFAAIIVFHPELRAALARLGQSRMLRVFNRLEEAEVFDELIDAVARLSQARIGAIIAVAREVGLDEYAETGARLHARVSADLVVSVFSPYGPLHDGALLVQGDTIIAAGVILPLTQFPVSDKSLGTRHRAALGLSEETDALVLVVSEETSQVSIAHRGRLERNVGLERVRAALMTGTSAAAPPAADALPAES